MDINAHGIAGMRPVLIRFWKVFESASMAIGEERKATRGRRKEVRDDPVAGPTVNDGKRKETSR